MIEISSRPLGIIFWTTALIASIAWQFLRLVLTTVPGITLGSRVLVLGVAGLMLALSLLLSVIMVRRRSEFKSRGLMYVMLLILIFEVAQCIVGFVEVARTTGNGHV